jgi:hypothetical protein
MIEEQRKREVDEEEEMMSKAIQMSEIEEQTRIEH